ncbi:hypothetical protein OH76DRAFT_1410997 [Lentinus brumalis]|uniref:Uncharacterized protein n=1 Tax=Lentinus brumalis TaxID=2498619 RepID=A0A371CQM4_9APHY|nr:hypothetical protein OH76DRAFT_1410997 [Polyporus brumalis]
MKMQYDASSRGTNFRPINASYPGFEFSTLSNWTATLANVGTRCRRLPRCVWQRSVLRVHCNVLNQPGKLDAFYARSGYIDPLPPRDNLAILPNTTVTRLLFDNSNAHNLTVTGVEWATSADGHGQRATLHVYRRIRRLVSSHHHHVPCCPADTRTPTTNPDAFSDAQNTPGVA